MKHRARGWHLALLGLIAVIVPAIAFRDFDFHSIPPWSDYWDYLQLGRQLQSGHGFSSLFTYPVFLKYAGSGPFFPLVWRPPLYPMLVAGTFLLTGGPSLWAPLALQIAGYILIVLGTYFLALEFTVPAWALLAGMVTALSPDMLGLAEPGIATVPFTAGLTFAFLLAVRARTRRRAFVAGLWFGAMILFRAEMLLVIPAIVWMLWAGERGDRESRIWHFVAAGILVLLPWTIRTWVVTGRPFTNTSSLLFTNTPLFPGWESSRRLDTLDRSALLWALSHPGMVTWKALRNAYHFILQALLLPIAVLAPFVWAAIGRLARVGIESAYCAAVLIGIVLFILFLSPLEYAPRFLYPFIPAVTVVAVIVLARFREDLGQGPLVPVTRRPAVWVAIAVVALSTLELAGAVAQNRRARTAPVIPTGAVWNEIGSTVPPGDWGFADYPACYAWFTGSRFVWVPVLDQFDRIGRSSGSLRTVVLEKGRGGPDFDPTGIPATAALSDSLQRRGWSARDVGPFVVLQDPAAAAQSGSLGQRP